MCAVKLFIDWCLHMDMVKCKPIYASFLCLQQPALCPLPKQDECSQHPPSCFLNIHSNIILSSMPRSHKQPISFRLFHQNHSWISLLPHAGHIFCLCLRSLITLITSDSTLQFFYFLYSKGMTLCIYENKTGLHRVRKHYIWYT
jgi:hypothetical protein